MKKILLQLDSDRTASSFDAITAYDAAADHVLQYGGVTPKEVRDLVYGAMFTRGEDDLKNSAVFIGGSDVSLGEEMMKAAVESFFGPMRVSVMLDSNGCNTTGAAAVRRIVSSGEIKGHKVIVLAGTGPVGLRSAALLAGEGARVILTSRSQKRSETACGVIKERFGFDVSPAEVQDLHDAGVILEGARAVLCAGAAGVTLLSESLWHGHPDLRVMADVNAVPPLGIEGIKPHWDGKIIDGKAIFGALGLGGLKMKIHRSCLVRLFEQNDLVMNAQEIYRISKTIDSQ